VVRGQGEEAAWLLARNASEKVIHTETMPVGMRACWGSLNFSMTLDILQNGRMLAHKVSRSHAECLPCGGTFGSKAGLARSRVGRMQRWHEAGTTGSRGGTQPQVARGAIVPQTSQ